MAEILGLGCTHRPVMLRRDEDWTFMMRTSLDDPDMPEAAKDPANWPRAIARGTRQRLGRVGGRARARSLPRAISPRRAARSTSSSRT